MKAVLVDQLRDSLARQAARLSQLHGQLRDAGSQWTREQLRLLLEAYAGFSVGDGDSEDPEVSLGEVSTEERLMDAVREILSAQQGRPVPLARVIELLPAHLTTSPEQLRAMAGSTDDLEIRGAMIRRKPGN